MGVAWWRHQVTPTYTVTQCDRYWSASSRILSCGHSALYRHRVFKWHEALCGPSATFQTLFSSTAIYKHPNNVQYLFNVLVELRRWVKIVVTSMTLVVIGHLKRFSFTFWRNRPPITCRNGYQWFLEWGIGFIINHESWAHSEIFDLELRYNWKVTGCSVVTGHHRLEAEVFYCMLTVNWIL